MPDPISIPAIPWQTLDMSHKMERAQNSLESAKRASLEEADPQHKEACLELESLFIYHLFKEMRATIPKSEFLNGGTAENIYTSMLDQQLARELASRGGIGISSVLLDQLGSKPENSTFPSRQARHPVLNRSDEGQAE
jgi:flagellar protein FlgJ